MEPVKLVKREDSLAYARRHDGNGVTPLQIGDEVKLPDYDQQRLALDCQLFLFIIN